MGLNLNYIEGQTTLAEQEKYGLLICSITTREELDEFEQQNIEKAILWLYKRKISVEKLLDEKFITQLHEKMFSDVWRWAGSYRNRGKNLGVSYSNISMELRKLLDDSKFWIENQSFSKEEIAIRFKHELVSIHCFSNGNGRHSRLMADLIMEKIFHKPYFSWGSSDLIKQTDSRKLYISAVKKAENNNFKDLIKFAKS